MALLDSVDALLLDLDGTIWEGGHALPQAAETLADVTVPALYITNNALRPATAVAEMLENIGITAAPENILTSAQAAVTLAKESLGAGDKVLVLGSESFKDLARRAGFEVVDSATDGPRAVLHGHSPDTGWRELSEAALAIADGAEYIASNLDTTLPTERGLLVGNGSMVAAVTSATGVRPRAAGKPEPAMFIQAAAQVEATRPLAVGDRLDTDIAGAVGAGIPVLHVLTGVSGPLALLSAPKVQRPTFIGENLAALREEPSVLAPGPQGGFTARVDAGDIIVSRGDEDATPIQALRTALEVAWHMPEPPRLVRPNSDAAERACAEWW
ncbi:HAD-IIA family hydrolase [Corynebacterium timonense]|uniref:Haloacid Dehalogenase Superfamily Class (Subfamily) IIA n=1 Tax=Corynebacterium timonense TaxID=441500 RepID=A0A1H1PFT7_9CORY|nr:HAD-IIA family hydrolase [Corynebacterium timonense]SDS10102.1 Haloacid Dehalogenase Superfamily Class (subfamily) IIA [Corynebacterium timonense]